jgi:hypothetical protein
MPITIPDRTQIRFTAGMGRFNEDVGMPTVLAQAAMTNPGPVAVYTGGPAANGQIQVVPAAGDAGRAGYVGYNISINVGAGEPLRPASGVTVTGFAGATPGSQVFVDDTTADASGTASGITHTAPTTGTEKNPIGVAVSSSKIYFFGR